MKLTRKSPRQGHFCRAGMGSQLPWRLRKQVNAKCGREASLSGVASTFGLSVGSSGTGVVPEVLAKLARLSEPLFEVATHRLLHAQSDEFANAHGYSPEPEHILRLRRLPRRSPPAARRSAGSRGTQSGNCEVHNTGAAQCGDEGATRCGSSTGVPH